MEYFPAPLEKLVEQFASLPGIGGKSAQRLAFYMLSLSDEEARSSPAQSWRRRSRSPAARCVRT